MRKPYLMGHSMGAETTATTAAAYPDLVGCAVLEDPPWREQTPTPEEQKAMFEEWRDRMIERKAKTRQGIVETGRKENPKWAEIEFGPWSEAKLQVSMNVLQAVNMPRKPWRDIIGKITCPTLLVTADPALGAIVTPEVAAQATRQSPHIQVARIEGAGHNIRRENFDQFMNAVTALAVRQLHQILEARLGEKEPYARTTSRGSAHSQPASPIRHQRDCRSFGPDLWPDRRPGRQRQPNGTGPSSSKIRRPLCAASLTWAARSATSGQC